MKHASLISTLALILSVGCGGTAPNDDSSDPGHQRSDGSEDGTPSSCTLGIRPDTRSYDPIEAGTSRSYEIHLTNLGSEPCAVTNVSLERGRDVVRLAPVEDRVLAAGAELLLRLTFEPAEAIVVEPTVRLLANGETFERGFRFEAYAHTEPSDSCVTLEPARLVLEVAAPGCGTAEGAIVLHNHCEREVRVMEADTGDNAAFSRGAVPELPRGVPAGGELRFPVLFSPLQAGETTGRLRIRVDGMPAFEVRLVGHAGEATSIRDVFHAADGQRVFELSHWPARIREGSIDEQLEIHVSGVLVRPFTEGERNWGYGDVRNLVEFIFGRGPPEGAEVVIQYRACPL
ncbi:hypothetical protein [Vulgatibacter incomptus]|uniref:Lipoprotein n=1 Tax=Vulgatibacter incomptus TaxID=1391653 RepID=A0A0K1PBB8_9BACT|nr:hypothetical protein [Vulgatibacter incomptus]AKU90787.1 hypothetical protein AKJ08_1174 [Vulgatibacter incomptus]